MPLQLRDKSDFIPKLTAIANVFKSNPFNTYSLFPQFIGVFVQTQTLGHLSPQAQIFNGGSKSSCSGKFHPRKFQSALPFSIFTSDFSLCLFLIGAFHRAFDSY
jgi:hypothetical protein